MAKEEFNFEEEIHKIMNNLPYMESPTRTELAQNIFRVKKEFIRRLKEEINKSEFKVIEHDDNFNEWGVIPVGNVFEKIDELAGEKLK